MKNKVYAQVYSMIRTFPEGLLDALKYFSEVGYDGVELIGTNTEGMSVSDFKAYVKSLNLDVVAMHPIGGTGELEFAAEMGARYISTDIQGEPNTREALLPICQELNRKGKELEPYGMKLVVHNHAYEFDWIIGEEGQTRVYDVLMEYTDPTVVGFVFDVGWAALVGVDCAEYVRKYPGRFPVIHVKECDRIAATREEAEHFPKRIFNEGMERDPETGVPILSEEVKQELYETRNWNKALGKGIINWPELVEAADAQGCVAYISEREYYHYEGSDGTNACCVQLDYDYLRSL